MKLISDVTAPALGHGCTTSKLARPHNIYTMPQPSVSPFPFVVYKSMEEPDSNDVSAKICNASSLLYSFVTASEAP